jgi:hypothetical protein
MYVINLNMSCRFITGAGSQFQISTATRNSPGSSQVHAARPEAPPPAGQGQIVGCVNQVGSGELPEKDKNDAETHKLYDNFSSISMMAA